MANHEHEGMKKCTKCGEWKPATVEYFYRDKNGKGGLRSCCKDCMRKYREKNKDKMRKYREKNKDKITERMREYREKNKDKLAEREREYKQAPVGKLAQSIDHLRRKTGATIYLRDMTDEEKEFIANQRIAVQTLEKTEKKLLTTGGKKRCSACDRILDRGCFNKNITKNDGVDCWCGKCRAEYSREYRKQNKDKKKEYQRKYRQQKKDKTREYYEKNKDKINDRRRQANKENKKHLTK